MIPKKKTKRRARVNLGTQVLDAFTTALKLPRVVWWRLAVKRVIGFPPEDGTRESGDHYTYKIRFFHLRELNVYAEVQMVEKRPVSIIFYYSDQKQSPVVSMSLKPGDTTTEISSDYVDLVRSALKLAKQEPEAEPK